MISNEDYPQVLAAQLTAYLRAVTRHGVDHPATKSLWAHILRDTIGNQDHAFVFWYTLAFEGGWLQQQLLTPHGAACAVHGEEHTFGIAFMHDNLGVVPTDDVPPPIRLVGRFVTASINKDHHTALALWQAIPDQETYRILQATVHQYAINAAATYANSGRDL